MLNFLISIQSYNMTFHTLIISKTYPQSSSITGSIDWMNAWIRTRVYRYAMVLSQVVINSNKCTYTFSLLLHYKSIYFAQSLHNDLVHVIIYHYLCVWSLQRHTVTVKVSFMYFKLWSQLLHITNLHRLPRSAEHSGNHYLQ